MKLYDHTQNLGIRVSTIQIIGFVLLTILGARLYYLQINKGEYYAEKAENQRIRLIPIPAPRGAILDRNGKILVDSRPTYNVTDSNEVKKLLAGDRFRRRAELTCRKRQKFGTHDRTVCRARTRTSRRTLFRFLYQSR